ncbi:hypothetical protein EHF33_02225 [Deinococcus psychrotolerans]|uniref:Integral membrane protein n=1 Tax=Deinococcus psychrotolerans TaxID=2489213 RepID=A0A3G8Y8L5_9DEIO|nr:hypothetical protein [Deinococcus psychrotolerans]AZI41708.1 hypothetical protein EHF33_02225 [Deinococcus psychrotolerans]
MNATAESIRAGFRVVSGLLILIIGINLLRVITNTLRYGGFSFGLLLSFALLVGLCWAVYNGKIWARVVLALLLLLNAVSALIAGLSFGGGLGAFVALIGALQFLSALSLFVIPQVNAYFEYAAAQS